MIAPSLWRQHILKAATAIEKRAKWKRITRTSSMNLEKDLMLAFYMGHKLLEDHRIPDQDGAIPIPVDAFQSSGKMDYLRDTKKVRRSLQGQVAEPTKLKLRVLTNKIIHSYLIVPVSGENEPARIAICSEFEHNTRLFVVLVSDLVSVLRHIAEDSH